MLKINHKDLGVRGRLSSLAALAISLAAGLSAFAEIAPSEAKVVDLPATTLAWDADSKEYAPGAGEQSVNVAFHLTNVSKEDVLIQKVSPSCGCTTMKLPALPWKIPPKGTGEIASIFDLRGKRGKLVKHLTVDSSHGRKILTVSVKITGDPLSLELNKERAQNLTIATADPQAIFKGTCANCHSKPAQGRHGEELYNAACAVCHDSESRASMVPLLTALPQPTNSDFWKDRITNGKPGTLMPPFAEEKGGPLTAEQIASLADYLAKTIPPEPRSPIVGPSQAPVLPNAAK